jgi:hypothetical protein
MKCNNVREIKIIEDSDKYNFTIKLKRYINQQPSMYDINIEFKMGGVNKKIYIALVIVSVV